MDLNGIKSRAQKVKAPQAGSGARVHTSNSLDHLTARLRAADQRERAGLRKAAPFFAIATTLLLFGLVVTSWLPPTPPSAGDVAFRVHPVTDMDAAEMIRQVKGYKLLEGVRGESGVDMASLEEAVQRISQLVGDFPQIAELDINPFVVFEPGRYPVAVDARVILSSEAGDSASEHTPPETAAGK